MAPGSPTGERLTDVVVKAIFGYAVVAVGSRASRPVVVAAAVIAAIAATGSEGQVPAHLALGVAFGLLLTVRKSPLGAAAVLLGVVQSVLRLDGLSNLDGLSALAAAVATVPPLLVGYRKTRSRDRKRIAVVAGVIAVVTVAFGLGAAASGLLARRSLESAVDAAASGLELARQGDAEGVRAKFGVAASGFTDAGDDVGRWWLGPARLIPIVGPHVRLMQEVSASGRDVALAAAEAGTAVHLDALRVVDGTVDVKAVAALDQPLARTADAADRARSRLRDVDSPWLLPPLRHRLTREITRLDGAESEARAAHDAVVLLPGLLGANGPRRYFLAIQSPSEARASGGFIGNYGELTADAGRLHLDKIGRTADLNEGGAGTSRGLEAPPDYVARYARFDPNQLWQNVTMSPDVPTVAKVITSQYPRSGGKPVDGVIVVDPIALAAILQLTGPVTVAPWPEPITADNAAKILLFDQYVRLDGQPRIDFLGNVAEAVWAKLTTGALPPPRAIVDALGPMVAGKHLVVTSSIADEAASLHRLHLDGAMLPVDGDFLAVITQNASGNKIDWFLRKRITYDVDLDAAGKLRATITVQLKNEAPSDGLPGYVIGNLANPPLPQGTNKLYLSVYTPWSLAGATADGQSQLLESEKELGRNVYSAFIVVPPGVQRELRLKVTGDYGDARYRIRGHAQPMATPDDLKIVVRRQGMEVLANAGPFARDVAYGEG